MQDALAFHIDVGTRVQEESDQIDSRWVGRTLDDLRKAVSTLEDAGRIARRVFGSANPLPKDIERELRISRAALRARETSRSA